MSNQLQKQDEQRQIMQVSETNWQTTMQALPIRAETSIEAVVSTKCANLGQLNAGMDNTIHSQAVLAALVLDLTSYFGLSWSRDQITECAATWFAEYPYMSMAEIKHFVGQCKSGKFTRSDFRHLSPFLLLGWLSDYMDEVLQERRRYADDQEAVKRHRENVKRQTDPSYKAFDISAALAAIGQPIPKSDEEQAEEDMAFQARRDEMLQAYKEMYGVDLDNLEQTDAA